MVRDSHYTTRIGWCGVGGGKQIFIWNLNRLLGMAWSINLQSSGKLGYHIINTFHGQKKEALHTKFNKVISILSMIRTNFSAISYCWNSIYCIRLCTSCPALHRGCLHNTQPRWSLIEDWVRYIITVWPSTTSCHLLVINTHKKNNLFTPSDIKVSPATLHGYFPSAREKHLDSEKFWLN